MSGGCGSSEQKWKVSMVTQKRPCSFCCWLSGVGRLISLSPTAVSGCPVLATVFSGCFGFYPNMTRVFKMLSSLARPLFSSVGFSFHLYYGHRHLSRRKRCTRGRCHVRRDRRVRRRRATLSF